MNICVYGASSNRLDGRFFEEARALGRTIAREGHSLVYGGGAGGLMGACAAGALEAGGHIVGIAPRFFDEPGVLLKGVGEFIFTETMSERKTLMENMAQAFIALPGGIGTFEEFFETFTLKQLGKHSSPMVLLNTLGYYEPMMELLRNTAERGFMSKDCLELVKLVGTPEEALAHCLEREESRGSIYRLSESRP